MGEARGCVLCRMRPVDPRWRPFCSERCRNVDLARWVDGAYRIEAATSDTALEDTAPPDETDADSD